MSEIPKLIQRLIDYRDNPQLSEHKIVFGRGITYGGHLVIDKIEADLPNIRKIKIGARCYNFLADNNLLEGLKVSIILDDNINSHMEFNSVTLTNKPIFLQDDLFCHHLCAPRNKCYKWQIRELAKIHPLIYYCDYIMPRCGKMQLKAVFINKITSDSDFFDDLLFVNAFHDNLKQFIHNHNILMAKGYGVHINENHRFAKLITADISIDELVSMNFIPTKSARSTI